MEKIISHPRRLFKVTPADSSKSKKTVRKEKNSQSQPSLLFSGRLHGLRVVRVVWVQQVLRQRPHHSDPYDQTGAPVWGHPLSRDHPEEEVQDPEVQKQSQGGERRWGEGRRRKEKETWQTERGSGRGAARFIEMIRFIYCFKLLHKLICSLFAGFPMTGCRMQPWSSWTDCTKPCGGGIQERFMNVKKRAKGAAMASCKDRKEIRACNVHPC